MLDLAESMPLRGTSITLVPVSNPETTIQRVPANATEIISNLTPTASPQLGGPRGLHPTPSPDSAIHSASGHSPSQSPISGRQLSGLSSPFSIRGTPSLSRNNSDASQNGRPASPGAPMSPMTLGHMPSPQNSPITNRQPHIPCRQITLPSSPLPPNTITASKASTASSTASTITLYQHAEAIGEGPMSDVSSMTAPPGISRQQLINR